MYKPRKKSGLSALCHVAGVIRKFVCHPD